MKESFWGLFVVILGVIGISIINVFQTISTSGSHDYFLLKEVTEASMMDAVDLGHYRRYGEIKMIKEKFMENFLRRFAESFSRADNRSITFCDINEMPPKVTIILDNEFETRIYNFDEVELNINNVISGILESKYPFNADEINFEPPSLPGEFTAPQVAVNFINGQAVNLKWGEPQSWGIPATNRYYNLQYKCGNEEWVTVPGTVTSNSATLKASCGEATLQYRVRAESTGGFSNWRYSEIINRKLTAADLPPITLNSTGKVQTHVISETGKYKLEVWGAQGEGSYGGKGGYSSGTIILNKDVVLYIYVGNRQGYNGGGVGGYNGGGATDIRKNGTNLNNRIIVAGGGGGMSNGPYAGGIGGGANGGNGSGNYGGPGGGATQSRGGIAYITKTASNPGTTLGEKGALGQGGAGAMRGGSLNAGGGGGGYYGGAGGSTDYEGYRDNDDFGGGGGSGYIGGVTNGVTNAGINAGNGKVKITFIE